MTVQQAIEILEINAICSPKATKFKEAVETVKQALGKQIPKKPVKKNPICYSKTKEGQELYAYDYHCPMCDTKLKTNEHHCLCGQALDWSDTE